MKRWMAWMLVCAVIVLSMTLVSCGACKEHAWDGGVITTEATDTSDGVKTFTCMRCKETKTEAVSLARLLEDAWNAALATEVFENFSYKESAVVSTKKATTTTRATYKFTENRAWARITIAGKSQEEDTSDKKQVNEARESFVQSLRDVLPYGSYTYDTQTNTYKANKEIYIKAIEASTSDITVTFDGERFVEIAYEVAFQKNGVAYTVRASITLSDYGTVTMD